jgi:LPXTG-motif cell wall-anchored protein
MDPDEAGTIENTAEVRAEGARVDIDTEKTTVEGDADSGGGGGDNGGDNGDTTDTNGEASPSADTDDEGDVIAGTVPETTELPETGGASLLALGAGLALVAGAASLIRLRR